MKVCFQNKLAGQKMKDSSLEIGYIQTNTELGLVSESVLRLLGFILNFGMNIETNVEKYFTISTK